MKGRIFCDEAGLFIKIPWAFADGHNLKEGDVVFVDKTY
jgi:hypothetical protein